MTEKAVTRDLITLARKDGELAFSRQGPYGESGAEIISNMGWTVWSIAKRSYGEAEGEAALRRVFDAVETWVYAHHSESVASGILSALDHRFDGIGGWYA